MKHLIEHGWSDVLAWMIDHGLVRLDWLEDTHRYWAAYRCEVVGMRTAPIMVGALSQVAVVQVATDLVRAFRWTPEYAGARARLWASLAGECPAEGDLRRGSYSTHLLLVGVN